MVGLNRVQLIGHLGRDPELKDTPNGKKVCTFSVAVNRRKRDKEGESQQVADWFISKPGKDWQRFAVSISIKVVWFFWRDDFKLTRMRKTAVPGISQR